jgi:iron complex transport system permease protein
MQSLFRNPLADPGLVGTSSGAALAAVAVIVLGDPLAAMLPGWARAYLLPAAAFAGALATTAMLYAIATREGRTSIATMLLAGIAIAALAMAVLGLFVFVSDDRQLRELTFWSLGSLGGANWEKVGVVLPFIGLALLAFDSWRAASTPCC